MTTVAKLNTPEQAELEQTQSPLQQAIRSLLNNNSAVTGMSIIGALILIAIFAPLIATHDPIRPLIGEPGYVGRLGGRGPCIPAFNNWGCGELASNAETLAAATIFFDTDEESQLVLNGGEAQMLQTDVSAMSNIAHTIDGVLTPPADEPISVQEPTMAFAQPLSFSALEEAGEFTTLFALIEATESEALLSGNAPFTLLAPNDAAFEAYFDTQGTTFDEFVEDTESARQLLAYHVLPGRQDAEVLNELASAEHHLHIMGIDRNSRDLFSRVIYGTRISLTVGAVAVTFAITIGTLTGLISGYMGGWVDNIVMRVMDVLLAFPSLLLAIAIVTILGPGLQNALIAIGIVTIPQYARLVRANVLSIKEQEFIEAERALGAGPLRIIFYHVLPNSITPIIVQGTLGIGTAILDAAALSFIGLGAQPPTPEWGFMLSQARDALRSFPHLMFFPGVAIMITVLGFNLLGDGMRDAFDPRLNKS